MCKRLCARGRVRRALAAAYRRPRSARGRALATARNIVPAHARGWLKKTADEAARMRSQRARRCATDGARGWERCARLVNAITNLIDSTRNVDRRFTRPSSAGGDECSWRWGRERRLNSKRQDLRSTLRALATAHSARPRRGRERVRARRAARAQHRPKKNLGFVEKTLPPRPRRGSRAGENANRDDSIRAIRYRACSSGAR